MRPAAVARGVGIALAVAIVLVLGVPAMLGWVPLPVSGERSGVPAGTLVVVEPADPTVAVEPGDVVTVVTSSGALTTRTVQSADAASLTLSAGGTTTSRVDRTNLRAVERYQIPLLGHVVGALPATQRPWWARLLGVAFLAWAAAELWSFVKRRRPAPADEQVAIGAASAPRAITSAPAPAVARAPEAASSRTGATRAARGSADRPTAATAPGALPRPVLPQVPTAPTSLASPTARPLVNEAAPAPRARGSRSAAARAYGGGIAATGALPDPIDDPLLAQVTGPTQAGDSAPPTPATDPALEHLPTRRERARARRTSPWSRISDAAASAVGAAVMVTRTFDRRHEDPTEDGGRHRNRMPATPIEIHADEATRAAAAPMCPADAAASPSRSTAPAPVASALDSSPPVEVPPPLRAAAKQAGEVEADLWAERAPKAEVERAALIQDFEARRAAAEATLLLGLARGLRISPADRLLSERETGRAAREPGATETERDGGEH